MGMIMKFMNFATITTLAISEGDSDASLEPGDPFKNRTVGIFPNRDAAIGVLEKNYGDLNEEGYYPYAIPTP